MRTLFALFNRFDQAATALQSLPQAGVTEKDISFVANNMSGALHEHDADSDAIDGPGRTGSTQIAGSIADSHLAFVIREIGPVVASGWLVDEGAMPGPDEAIRTLTKAGIAELDAHVCAEALRRGGTLVCIRVQEVRAKAVSELLHAAQGVEIAARRRHYAREGWTTFEEVPPGPHIPTMPSPPMASLAGGTRSTLRD